MEQLGHTIDFDGFEIDILADLVRNEIGNSKLNGMNKEELKDLNDVLDKLTNRD